MDLTQPVFSFFNFYRRTDGEKNNKVTTARSNDKRKEREREEEEEEEEEEEDEEEEAKHGKKQNSDLVGQTPGTGRPEQTHGASGTGRHEEMYGTSGTGRHEVTQSYQGPSSKARSIKLRFVRCL